MRKIQVLIGAVFMVAGQASQAAPAFNDPADVTAITAIENGLATQAQTAKIIGYYAPDALLEDVYVPGVYQGRRAIYGDFNPQLSVINPAKFQHTMPELNILSDGRFACAALQLHFDLALKDGTPVSLSMRQLDGLKKIDGKWQIIQEQISMPADEKTGMAVMDGPLPVEPPMAWGDDPLPGPAESPALARADIRKWLDAIAASTSIAQVVTYYGPGDQELLYDELIPGELRGLRAIHDHYAPVMSGVVSAQVRLPVFEDDSDGLLGVEMNTQKLVLTMKGGRKLAVSFRQSDCLRLVGGKWYSFFEMVSFPVVAKTGKAVMD